MLSFTLVNWKSNLLMVPAAMVASSVPVSLNFTGSSSGTLPICGSSIIRPVSLKACIVTRYLPGSRPLAAGNLNFPSLIIPPELLAGLPAAGRKLTEPDASGTPSSVTIPGYRIITSDEYKPYRQAILKAYGEKIVPERTGKPGRPKTPYYEPSPTLRYATVHKTREKGRVVKIDFRVVFGTVAAVTAALKLSKVSNKINTAFVERQNGTDRGRNGRKTRKTYCFSKDWDIHDAVTYFTMYTYNFCWPVRTLRQQGPDGQWLPQTPAMAAGPTDHVWSLWEWLTFPAVQRE